MGSIRRFSLPVHHPAADANLRPRYPLEQAAWIWAPGKRPGELAVVRFENRFTNRRAQKVKLHVSADMRYTLSLDGEIFSRGPDRCDLHHWSFASYEVALQPGRHVLTAVVWWIGEYAPHVQRTHRGGFILAAEGALAGTLNTGTGNWRVEDLDAWSFAPWPGEVGSMIVGHYQTIHGDRWFSRQKKQTPVTVSGPMPVSEWSGVFPGWRLEPSELPDQFSRLTRAGRVVAVIDGGLDLETALPAAALAHAAIPTWQALLDRGRAVKVPAGRSVSVLVDLGDYYCGYSRARTSGGKGADLSIIWAEGLFERPASNWSKHKGHRDEVVGKYYRGLRDTFALEGGRGRDYEACWWRCGRYWLVTVRGGRSAVTVEDLGFRETRYPFERAAQFETDDPALSQLFPLAERSLLMNAHETFMDCPHYEQTFYVGDGRLELLTAYTLYADDRLCRRGLRLLDWSRHPAGFLNSGYPAGPQIISSFPMYWPLLLHDSLYWRGDAALVRELLPGARANHGWLETLRGADGLLHPLPGWSFIDTAPEWADFIYGSNPRRGANATLNLLYVYATQKLAEIEEHLGERELAARNRRLAREVFTAVMKGHWDAKSNLVADYAGHREFSEHAQCMAILTGLMPRVQENACFAALTADPALIRVQPCYWMFYLFEVYRRHRRGDLVLSKLQFWKEIPNSGLKTAPEMYEPSRSDCHGWGAHVLFHLLATVLGVRPTAPGFAAVEIAPAPGHLQRIRAALPHPRGQIAADLRFAADTIAGTITLPAGVRGELHYRDRRRQLKPGANRV